MVALVILTVLTLLGFVAMNTSALQIKVADNFEESTRDFHDAESGLSEAFAAFLGNPAAQTETGWPADWTIQQWETGTFITHWLASSTDTTVTVRQFFRQIDISVIVDGTIGCYDGCDVDLIGNVHVDGRDHDPESCVLGGPASCSYDLEAAGEADIPAVYQAEPGTVTQGGSTSLAGADPVIVTGGGVYTVDQWSALVTALVDHASGHNGSAWGAEGSPIIHVINEDGYTINSNTTGAGVLVITANHVKINGAFRFEGLIIMRHEGGVHMELAGGADICGAIVATSPGSMLEVGGAGTPRITYCSAALNGAAGGDAINRTAWMQDKS
jgi:hypothetical protein